MDLISFTGQEDYERLRPLSYPNVSIFKCQIEESPFFAHFSNEFVCLFRRIAFCCATQSRAEFPLITCCQNGIQKSDIFRPAFPSFLLVRASSGGHILLMKNTFRMWNWCMSRLFTENNNFAFCSISNLDSNWFSVSSGHDHYSHSVCWLNHMWNMSTNSPMFFQEQSETCEFQIPKNSWH